MCAHWPRSVRTLASKCAHFSEEVCALWLRIVRTLANKCAHFCEEVHALCPRSVRTSAKTSFTRAHCARGVRAGGARRARTYDSVPLQHTLQHRKLANLHFRRRKLDNSISGTGNSEITHLAPCVRGICVPGAGNALEDASGRMKDKIGLPDYVKRILIKPCVYMAFQDFLGS